MNVVGGLTSLALLGAAACVPAPEPLPVLPWEPGPAAPRPADPVPAGPIDLASALDLAMRQAPAIRAARARADAAAAGGDLAEAAYYPRVDLIWQQLRATRNNVLGASLPQSVVPPISGPPFEERSWDHAWGSAAGMLVTWEPFDFGLRAAHADLARIASRQAELDLDAVRLEAGSAAAEAFVAHLAAREALAAVRANEARWQALARHVRELSDRDLRPAVDASRVEAEWAGARNAVIHAEQVLESSRLGLAQALNLPDGTPPVEAGPLLELPREVDLPATVPPTHPYLARTATALEASRTRQLALERSGSPRVALQGSVSGRGSGFETDGTKGDAEDGLYPDRLNWAAGFSMTIPLMDWVQLSARSRAEQALGRAELARGDQAYLELRIQNARVKSAHEAAVKTSANMEPLLKAARETQAAARARYDAGLGTLAEVAEAQRLLAQAEIDGALSRLAVWRTLVAAAKTQGGFTGLLRVLQRSRGKGN